MSYQGEGLFDSDSDKYWKEKEKAKNRPRKIIMIVSTVVALIVGGLVLKYLYETSVATSVEQARLEEQEKERAYNVAADTVRSKASDLCAPMKIGLYDGNGYCYQNVCKAWELQMPRPTLSNTCVDGCQKGADVGCADGVNSNSVEQCIESVSAKCSNDICRHYRTALPRPQVFQACQSGCNDAGKDFCNRGQKIFAAEMAKIYSGAGSINVI